MSNSVESEGKQVGDEKPPTEPEVYESSETHKSNYGSVNLDNNVTIENTSELNGLHRSGLKSQDSNLTDENGSVVVTVVEPNACLEHAEVTPKGHENADLGKNNFSDGAGKDLTDRKEFTEAEIKISRPLCADYRSGSDSESVDSESDSSSSTEDTGSTYSESENEENSSSDSETSEKNSKRQKEKKGPKDLSLCDLPPIEDLRISVPENACVEVGKISGIIDTLVVVESYKGSAALDVDTVLFLDSGKRTLGKVFDILGPVLEPVYTVRFNSQEQIQSLGIKKEQRVYYAPKTQHTTFVFLSEVLKNKGSDASWKDNVEAPPEFQDFSDDEEERLHKNKQKQVSTRDGLCSKERYKSRKRSFNRTNHTSTILQPPNFIYPSPTPPQQLSYNSPRHPPPNHRPPPAPPAPFLPPSPLPPPFPYTAPPYPPANIFPAAPPLSYPPRFSGPPFPTFSTLPFLHQNRPLHHPPFQQRTHAFPLPPRGTWTRPTFRPPPPPPPSDAQNSESPSGGKP